MDATINGANNGLDVARINPRNGPKYSPNLYAWLTQRTHRYRAWTSRVYADRSGTLYIGLIDGDCLHGSKLLGVLCNGRKETSWAFCSLGKLTEVVDFWSRYMAIGRCAIDPEHQMNFVGDESRWRVHGAFRECLWCGNHRQYRRIRYVRVEHSTWETVRA